MGFEKRWRFSGNEPYLRVENCAVSTGLERGTAAKFPTLSPFITGNQLTSPRQRKSFSRMACQSLIAAVPNPGTKTKTKTNH
jgi:hypothetical protein